jgi:hypothetical protein
MGAWCGLEVPLKTVQGRSEGVPTSPWPESSMLALRARVQQRNDYRNLPIDRIASESRARRPPHGARGSAADTDSLTPSALPDESRQ